MKLQALFAHTRQPQKELAVEIPGRVAAQRAADLCDGSRCVCRATNPADQLRLRTLIGRECLWLEPEPALAERSVGSQVRGAANGGALPRDLIWRRLELRRHRGARRLRIYVNHVATWRASSMEIL